MNEQRLLRDFFSEAHIELETVPNTNIAETLRSNETFRLVSMVILQQNYPIVSC